MRTPANRLTWISGWLVTLTLAYVAGTLQAPSSTADSAIEVHTTASVASSAPASQANQLETARPRVSDPARARLQQTLADERWFDAIEVLDELLIADPGNLEHRFLLATLYERTRQPLAAISQYLAIRATSLELSDLDRARRGIDRLLADNHAQFSEAWSVDPARVGAEATEFFQSTANQEPNYDLHRWYLAQWLVRTDDVTSAERLAREMGYAGVSENQLDELMASIETRQSTLPITQQHGVLQTILTISTPNQTADIELLVDTGATMTAISISTLNRLGAERTGRSIHAQTANGMVELPLYKLRRLSGGPIDLENVLVAGLYDHPAGSQGLLGLDIIGLLPEPLIRSSD